ncbi:unnamed protein product [Orchesella dallaii]|uniref:SMB domain-containing protein n=1 Tax=Orchesella dallaii TaxID=48710 RepID=A0ABP1REK5_9HEXA
MKLICNPRCFVFVLILITLTLSTLYFIFFVRNQNKKGSEDTSTELVNNGIKIPLDNFTISTYAGGLSLSENGSSNIDWENGFKTCGDPMEGCNNSYSDLDYMHSPMYCRCDSQCIKYGDCCVTVLKEIEEIPVEPLWRCVKLPNSEHGARMISKCTSGSSDENWMDRKRCENMHCDDDPTLCSWLDIPVLDKKCRDLYRNIFCARCNGISNSELYNVRHSINCTKPKKVGKWNWEEFTSGALYQGNLKWVDQADPELICEMKITLLPDSMQEFVPEIRFYPLNVDESCDLGNEKNKILYQLCHSYMQVVSVPVPTEKTWFKNAHCAKCNYPQLITNITKTGKCYRLPSRNRHYWVSNRVNKIPKSF